jgi:hypothetical protein
MKKRKFSDGGETVDDVSPKDDDTDNAAVKSGQNSNIGDDTRSRAAAWVAKMQGNKDDTTPPVVTTKTSAKTPTAAGGKSSTGNTTAKGKTGSGDIPVDPELKAPKATGEDTSGPSNVGRALSAFGAGAGLLGVGTALRTAGHAGRAASQAAGAIRGAQLADKMFTPTTSAGNIAKDTSRFTPKQEVEAAESTMRGATSRAALRAKNTPKKSTNFEEADTGYKRGGGVKKYAKGGSIDGIAQRGKTRGKYC